MGKWRPRDVNALTHSRDQKKNAHQTDRVLSIGFTIFLPCDLGEVSRIFYKILPRQAEQGFWGANEDKCRKALSKSSKIINRVRPRTHLPTRNSTVPSWLIPSQVFSAFRCISFLLLFNLCPFLPTVTSIYWVCILFLALCKYHTERGMWKVGSCVSEPACAPMTGAEANWDPDLELFPLPLLTLVCPSTQWVIILLSQEKPREGHNTVN